MPSSITHQLVAEEVLSQLSPALREIVQSASDEYFLGCQGPDLFFFYRIGCRSEYNLGKFLHRYRIYETFSLFLEALSGKEGAPRWDETQKKQALGYVLGYITHYCADSAFHPFVYNYLENTHGEKREHQQMENDWDVYFLRELREREAERFTFAFSGKRIVEHGTAARLFGYLAPRLGREDVTPSRFRRGVKNFSRYLKFFHKRCYRSQRRWQRTERFFHAKRFLSRLYPRRDPAPEYVSGAHFEEFSRGTGNNAAALFANAVRRSVALIGEFMTALEEGTPLPREDFCNSLLTAQPAE